VNYPLAHAILSELRMSPETETQTVGIWKTFDEKAWEDTLTWLDLREFCANGLLYPVFDTRS
jgi:hypothetical protein